MSEDVAGDDVVPDITALVEEVLTHDRTLAEHTRSQPSDTLWVAGGEVHARWRDAHDRLEAHLSAIKAQLQRGDASGAAADAALEFLEADPYYFWSGYARTRVARSLSHAPLDAFQRRRARQYVLEVVDGTKHCESRGIAPLAGAVADNAVRRALRSHLHSADQRVARRALRALMRVKHPGLTDSDLVIARDLVLHDAANTPWLQRNVERLARWLWTPEWEAELRDLTRHHGPERAAAKKLIESMDRRRARRPGP